MNTKTAAQATRRYYTARAFLGNMDGYTTDELVEWSTLTMADFLSGGLTMDDVLAAEAMLDS